MKTPEITPMALAQIVFCPARDWTHCSGSTTLTMPATTTPAMSSGKIYLTNFHVSHSHSAISSRSKLRLATTPMAPSRNISPKKRPVTSITRLPETMVGAATGTVAAVSPIAARGSSG